MLKKDGKTLGRGHIPKATFRAKKYMMSTEVIEMVVLSVLDYVNPRDFSP